MLADPIRIRMIPAGTAIFEDHPEYLERLIGTPIGDFARRHKPLLEQTRNNLLAEIPAVGGGLVPA